MLSSRAFLRSSNTGVKRTLNHGSPHSVKGCLEQFIQSLLCFSLSVCISWTGAKNAFQTVQVSNPDNVIQTSSRREVLENTWWYLISNPGKNKMNWGQSSEMLHISLCIFKLWKSLFTVKKKNPFLNKNKNIPKTKKIIHPVYNSISHILYLLVTAFKQSNSIKSWHWVKHPDPRNCVFMAAALNQAEIC